MIPSPKLLAAALTIALPLMGFFVLSNYEESHCAVFFIGGLQQLLDPGFKTICQLLSWSKWLSFVGFIGAGLGWAYALLSPSLTLPKGE